MHMYSEEPKIVSVLKRHPFINDGAEICKLMKELDLSNSQVRDRIGSARGKGYNIKNIAPNTFQLKCGTWRGRRG